MNAKFFLKNGLQCLAITALFAVATHLLAVPQLSCIVWWLFGHGFALVWVWAKMTSKELDDEPKQSREREDDHGG